MQRESLRKQAKDTFKNLFHHKKHTDESADMAQTGGAGDILQPTSMPKISDLGGVPKELKGGMEASSAQSAIGAPSQFEQVARNVAPPIAETGGVGHVPPPDTFAPASRQDFSPPTPEGAGYARLTEEGPLAPASTPVGSIFGGGSVHLPAPGVAADSVKRAHLSENPAMGAGLAKAGLSEEAALAAQDMSHTLHHTETHDTSAPYLGTGSGAASRVAVAKPKVTDVGADPMLREQTQPLLPSGKKSSPVTGHVPNSLLGGKAPAGATVQGSKAPGGHVGGQQGMAKLDESDHGKLGGAAAGGLGTGALLKEHADASKEQDLKSVDAEGAKLHGGTAAVPEAGLPSPAGGAPADTSAQAPSTLLGRTQEALASAAFATSAVGSTLVNKVTEATGMASNKAKATSKDVQQQTGGAAGNRGTGTGTGAGQQGSAPAPLQRVVEYGQAAAAKASEQAQAAYEAATAKLHETGLPQKAAEHRDAASAKASDLAAQAQMQAAQAQQVAAAKAAQLQDAARSKAAELYTQAADTSAAARDQAARTANQLYAQASDQAAVARDQAVQALGEGIDRVRNASTEDINRSRLARGAAMATLLWVLCMVLGIPFKFALTAAFMAVGGMMLKEFAQDRRGPRVGGRGPHGGVKTTEFSSHAPEGRDIKPPAAVSASAPDPSAAFPQCAPVNTPAPTPPMLGHQDAPAMGGAPPVSTPPVHGSSIAGGPTPAPAAGGGHETVHTEFGTIKVAKPVLEAALRAAKLVEE
ncbi:hypothetical protein WJX81_001260 [Elliptochloris bilobata]|uniref:Uncharacterized protein n=1 Tax=Elliptochloris bilobata TaxID=381761 RepID=A0AAW1SDJ9_9CHLO